VKKKILLLIPLILILLSIASITYAPAVVIDWYVVGPSSAQLSQNNVQLHSVVGQGTAGQVNHEDVEICSGYLCILTRILQRIFLPLILR
jgi:hypothetical protein